MDDNERFLRDAYAADLPRVLIISFIGDPKADNPGQWVAESQRSLDRRGAWPLDPRANNYFCVSLFNGDRFRQELLWECMPVLAVDDVGTGPTCKMDPGVLLERLGTPAYAWETSPGNQQWIYLLRPRIYDLAQAKALGLWTGGDAKSVTRVMRLPAGRNMKTALGPGGFRVEPVVLHQTGAVEGQLDIARVWDAVSQDVSVPVAIATRRVAIATRARSADDLIGDDLVGGWLRMFGMVKGLAPNNEAIDVTCPWIAEHTQRVDSGAAYFPHTQGFECHHGHCQDAQRDGAQLWAWLKHETIARGYAGGIATGQFAVIANGVANPDIALATLHDNLPPPLPRDWVAKGFLIREAVTMVFGPANQGKSLLLVGWAVALALGRAWGRFRPERALTVLTVFAEENDAEQSRRFHATLMAQNATEADLGGRVHRLVFRDLATLLTLERNNGLVETEGWARLRDAVSQVRPDVVFLDPLVELHTVDENDNTKTKAVIAKFRTLAEEFKFAVVLAHHARKANGAEALMPGSLDVARGASAIGGAVRIAFTWLDMSKNEADTVGIAVDRRRYYGRLDEARNAFAAPMVSALWFEKVGYPVVAGETTAALRPWSPPVAVVADPAVVAALVQAIAAGCAAEGSAPWSLQRRDNEPRSIRQLLRQHSIDRVNEDTVIAALMQEGVQERGFRNKLGYVRKGLCAPNGLPRVNWQ